MIYSEYLKNLFPARERDPGGASPARPIHQRSYLVDGVLKTLGRTVPDRALPVCVRGENGELEQVELGSYPLGGEAQARRRWTPPSPPTTMAGANGRP